MAMTRLPPFDDSLLEAEHRAQAFGFLKGMTMPGRYKAAAWRRWGEVVGAPATDDELGEPRGRGKLEE